MMTLAYRRHDISGSIWKKQMRRLTDEAGFTCLMFVCVPPKSDLSTKWRINMNAHGTSMEAVTRDTIAEMGYMQVIILTKSITAGYLMADIILTSFCGREHVRLSL